MLMRVSRVARHAALIIGCIAYLSAASLDAAPIVVVNDDFESYADTAAMQANWGATGAGTLDTTLGNPGQSALHPGGTVNTWIGSTLSLTPTDEAPLVLTADIYDDGTPTRNTVGFRNGANPLFEMGHYNETLERYHVRVLGMYGAESWVALEPGLVADAGAPVGWNRYQATFTGSDLTVTLDLGADGTIDGTFNSVGSPSANPFVDLRFGGPSNLSSVGPIHVDNISLAIVPEPSTLALAGLAMVGLVGFARRK
jgi:hypothetical protein